jgi:hypothetical protein
LVLAQSCPSSKEEIIKMINDESIGKSEIVPTALSMEVQVREDDSRADKRKAAEIQSNPERDVPPVSVPAPIPPKKKFKIDAAAFLSHLDD